MRFLLRFCLFTGFWFLGICSRGIRNFSILTVSQDYFQPSEIFDDDKSLIPVTLLESSIFISTEQAKKKLTECQYTFKSLDSIKPIHFYNDTVIDVIQVDFKRGEKDEKTNTDSDKKQSLYCRLRRMDSYHLISFKNTSSHGPDELETFSIYVIGKQPFDINFFHTISQKLSTRVRRKFIDSLIAAPYTVSSQTLEADKEQAKIKMPEKKFAERIRGGNATLYIKDDDLYTALRTALKKHSDLNCPLFPINGQNETIIFDPQNYPREKPKLLSFLQAESSGAPENPVTVESSNDTAGPLNIVASGSTYSKSSLPEQPKDDDAKRENTHEEQSKVTTDTTNSPTEVSLRTQQSESSLHQQPDDSFVENVMAAMLSGNDTMATLLSHHKLLADRSNLRKEGGVLPESGEKENAFPYELLSEEFITRVFKLDSDWSDKDEMWSIGISPMQSISMEHSEDPLVLKYNQDFDSLAQGFDRNPRLFYIHKYKIDKNIKEEMQQALNNKKKEEDQTILDYNRMNRVEPAYHDKELSHPMLPIVSAKLGKDELQIFSPKREENDIELSYEHCSAHLLKYIKHQDILNYRCPSELTRGGVFFLYSQLKVNLAIKFMISVLGKYESSRIKRIWLPFDESMRLEYNIESSTSSIDFIGQELYHNKLAINILHGPKERILYLYENPQHIEKAINIEDAPGIFQGLIGPYDVIVFDEDSTEERKTRESIDKIVGEQTNINANRLLVYQKPGDTFKELQDIYIKKIRTGGTDTAQQSLEELIYLMWYSFYQLSKIHKLSAHFQFLQNTNIFYANNRIHFGDFEFFRFNHKGHRVSRLSMDEIPMTTNYQLRYGPSSYVDVKRLSLILMQFLTLGHSDSMIKKVLKKDKETYDVTVNPPTIFWENLYGKKVDQNLLSAVFSVLFDAISSANTEYTALAMAVSLAELQCKAIENESNFGILTLCKKWTNSLSPDVRI